MYQIKNAKKHFLEMYLAGGLRARVSSLLCVTEEEVTITLTHHDLQVLKHLLEYLMQLCLLIVS